MTLKNFKTIYFIYNADSGYTGSHDIPAMRTKPRFVQITSAGVNESHVHDVSVTKEAPNYRMS